MRIAIVEDEIRIREGVEKLIRRISADHEIIGCADNGKDGLEMITQLRPDLVITDIKMPQMDGLEMLSAVKEKGKLPKAIILSAYSEFEYARQAIKLGVSEYILKPITVTEFITAFKKIERIIAGEKEQEAHKSREETFETIIREELFHGNEPDGHSKEILLEKYGFPADKRFCIVPVYLGPDSEKIKKQVQRELESLLREYTGAKSRIVELIIERKLLIFLWDYPDEQRMERWFQNRTAIQFSRNMWEQICFGWTELQSLGRLKEGYQKVCTALDWNIILGSGVLVSYPKVTKIQTVPVIYPIGIEQNMRESLCSVNEKKIQDSTERFLNYFKSGEIYLPREIKESFCRFIWSMLNVIKDINIECYNQFQQQEILESIMGAVTYRELENVLRGIIDNAELSENADVSKESLLVQRVKSMVHEFYSQGITLEEIAEEMQLTPEYLGTQFHKETGSTYSNYLKKYRIEKAKKLLLGTNLKTYEIAQKVGYSDPKYFSRVFKECTNTLPNEYRKKY